MITLSLAGAANANELGLLRRSFAADDPLVDLQWHLANTLGRPHVNISGAWELGYTGNGVTIGIVDDGLQWDHPDLSENYSAINSLDFGSRFGDTNPYPVHSNTPLAFGDNHGTSVAGVAAARGGNGVGTTGAAPLANLAGLRLDFSSGLANRNQAADATRYRSTGNDVSIDIKNHSYSFTTPYVNDFESLRALDQSAAAGTIHVVSAGNGRLGSGFGDSNKAALQASTNSITVGALAHTGRFAPYSSWGANLFVTAPSSGFGVAITTTDRSGTGPTGGYNFEASASDGDPLTDADYTSTFGGTSSSSPLVAGVLALAREANPRLDVRFAKHLLVRTSDSSIDSFDATLTSDGGWTTNAAGNRFNQNYGFGLVDATALVTAAPLYAGVTPQGVEEVAASLNSTVPDAVDDNLTPGVVSATFDLIESGELEEIIVELDIIHDYVGHLQATLESPSGTTSRLLLRDLSDSGNDLDWAFTTNAFWGEEAAGEWTLTVEDWFAGDVGTWNSYSVTALTGSLVAVPEPSTFALVASIVAAVSALARNR